jgi:hypothetical protein
MEEMIVLQSTLNEIYNVQLGVWLVIFMYKSIAIVMTTGIFTFDIGLESSVVIDPETQ